MTNIHKEAFSIGLIGIILMAVSFAPGCGSAPEEQQAPVPPPGMVTGPGEDGVVVRAIALVNVGTSQPGALNVLNSFIPSAYAASGSSTVTYVNAASVSFTLNVTNLGPAGFTGNTLSLGSVSIGSIDDNHLKVCGTNSNQKCNNAIIRVYTTGTITGFVNTDDSYGVPVYAGSLNPSTPVGLSSANSVSVQTISIANNKNRIRLVDLPTPTYSVSSDFSNAGSGPYSMTFVVEYGLSL